VCAKDGFFRKGKYNLGLGFVASGVHIRGCGLRVRGFEVTMRFSDGVLDVVMTLALCVSCTGT
jgi:hypothetical protein